MKIQTVFSENALPLQKSFKNIVKPVRAHAYNSALYALTLLTHKSGGKSKVCYKLQKGAGRLSSCQNKFINTAHR